MHVDTTEEKNVKRLNVELRIDLHCKVKEEAAKRNITMRKWIVRAINAALKLEQQYK